WITAENLDVDRLWTAAGKIADVILEQLPEIGVYCWLDGCDSGSQVIHHFLDTNPLALWLELDYVVAPVRLCNEKSKLLSRPARVVGDSGVRYYDAFCFAQHRVGLT